MSLGPTFVKFADGVVLKNPLVTFATRAIRNKRGSGAALKLRGFLCWDEDEPLELVIQHPGPSFSQKECVTLVRSMIRYLFRENPDVRERSRVFGVVHGSRTRFWPEAPISDPGFSALSVFLTNPDLEKGFPCSGPLADRQGERVQGATMQEISAEGTYYHFGNAGPRCWEAAG